MPGAESVVETIMHPLKFRSIEVRRTEWVTLKLRRITFGGDELGDFTTLAAGDHVKLLFPQPGSLTPVPPEVGPKGFSYPEGTPKPILRDYTPRRFDPVYREVAIDFVIHGAGPGASWAETAIPGAQLGMIGPRGSHVLTRQFAHYLLIGDETALPAIARRIEELPTGVKVIAIVEVADHREEQKIESDATVEWHWVHRDGEESGASDWLARAVRDVDLPKGDFFTYLAGEANSVRTIRRHLLNERGVRSEWSEITGHWKRNVADWDHHEPIADEERPALGEL